MPIYTPSSFVKTLAGTNAVHTLSLPVSALTDRRWFIANLAKDNRATPTPVTAISFNGNTIGAGIVEIGTRQIAIEGSFSSQAQVWAVKDIDGPTVAGNYNVVITTPQFAQGTHYCAFELSDANQSDVMDAIQLFSSIANIGAGNSYSHTITTIAANSLILDFWSQSTSSSPVITPLGAQVQIGVNMFNSSGGANVSSLVKAVAGPQVMGQTTNVLSQRQAGITLSIAPAGAPGPITANTAQINDAKREALIGRGFPGAMQDAERDWLLSVVTTVNGNTIPDLWYRYLIEQGQAPSSLHDMKYAWLGGLGYTGSLNDRLLAYWIAG